MLRRTVLAGLPAGLALSFSLKATADEAVSVFSGEESLARYCGVYRVGDAHHVGIERFRTDSGELILLFADYKTSLVRRLFPSSDTEFVYGPNLGSREPVEGAVTFHMNGAGLAQSIGIRHATASDVIADKIGTRDEDIAFEQRDARLAGRLILPPGEGPHPAVVLLHGSGPLTRNSFGPYPRFFNSLGLAVLIYDKRGTGASTGRRLDASTGAPETLWRADYPDDLADDALAALRFLQSRSDIDAKQIGFWGSSEGGMLSTHVASKSRDVAFAINSSGFMGPLWETLLWQGGAMMRANGASEADITQAMDFNRFWMEVARTGRGYQEFLRRRQTIIDSGEPWLFYFSGEFTSLAQMRWVWRRILSFDSLPALRRVRCPTLGVFGERDVLTNAQVASVAMLQALRDGGNRDAAAHVFSNASHSLMDATTRGGMATGVFDTLRDWLLARVGSGAVGREQRT